MSAVCGRVILCVRLRSEDSFQARFWLARLKKRKSH